MQPHAGTPCWAKQIKVKLDKYQRHCLRLIYPNLVNSASRLDTAGLTTRSIQLENQRHWYTLRIRSDTTHSLHDYIHTDGRISSRGDRFIPARTQTFIFAQLFWRWDCSDAQETKLSMMLINGRGTDWVKYSTQIYTSYMYVYEVNPDVNLLYSFLKWRDNTNPFAVSLPMLSLEGGDQ